jgi:peptidoglycan/LPS O-acetylase OafA/YrhL
VLVALTGAGLSAAAGLNAFIPFLIVGLLDRFTSLIDLTADMEWISSWWAIGIGAVLLIADVVLDKVPGVDHISDVVQTGIRPVMGGVMFAAASGAEQIEQSQWWRDNPWVGVVIGVVLAGTVHAGKALTRPVVNASTLGVGAPVVSAAEDAGSAAMSVIAVLVPVLVVVGLVLLGYGLYRLYEARRRWAERWGAQPNPPAPEPRPTG